MLICKKDKSVGSSKFLIKCNSCGVEIWYVGSKCRYGKRKFCSIKCINVGRSRSEEWKYNLSKRNSGKNNPFYGKIHSVETLLKIKEKGSWKDILKDKFGNDFDTWYKLYCENQAKLGKSNPFYGKKHSDEAKLKMSEIKASQIADGTLVCKNFNRGIKGWYHSYKMNENFYYDSFYEYIRMKMLDEDNLIVSWTKRHGIKIKYWINDVAKYYVPDFLIKTNDGKTIIEEIKGYEAPDKLEAKITALKKFVGDSVISVQVNSNLICRIIKYQELNTMCLEKYNHGLTYLRKQFNG